jgi:hypothetical protein
MDEKEGKKGSRRKANRIHTHKIQDPLLYIATPLEYLYSLFLRVEGSVYEKSVRQNSQPDYNYINRLHSNKVQRKASRLQELVRGMRKNLVLIEYSISSISDNGSENCDKTNKTNQLRVVDNIQSLTGPICIESRKILLTSELTSE